MNIEFILKLLEHPSFIIFISTFAGSFIGEFYREVNDKKPCSFVKFLSKFLASWITSISAVLLIQAVFEIGSFEILSSISIVFGFTGHKESVKYAKSLIASKFEPK